MNEKQSIISMEMVTWIHCHNLHESDDLFLKLASNRDGETFFKDSSLEMNTYLHGDDNPFFKLASLEMDTWFSSHHLRRLLGRW